MSERVERSLAWMLPSLGAALFFALWLDYRDFWLDDSFITFRYARNWAEGLGPNFNPGEAVEGYTTFSWLVFVTAAFILLPADSVLVFVKLCGLGLGLGVLWRSYTFPGPGGEPRRRAWVLLLAANPVFVANCGDGMETPLFMLLLLEAARASLAPTSVGRGAWVGVLAAACVWTRPEALLLLGGLPLVVLGFQRRAALPWLQGFALAALPLVIGHFAWRLGYYGVPFPNTFYAKASGELLARFMRGAAALGAFASAGPGVPAVGVWIAGTLAIFGLRRRQGAGQWLTLLWGIVGFRIVFDLWSGSEAMGTFRFLAPALPPLFVLADEGARGLAGIPKRIALAVGAVGLAVSVWGHAASSEARGRYTQGLERAHWALGEWLSASQPEGTWLAIGDAGVVPFVSRLPVIDLWGLADAHIARLPGEYGDRPGTADYVLERRPEIIVLWNLVPIGNHPDRLELVGAWPFDREIAQHPVFASEYRFVREFTFRPETQPRTGYYLDVFEHRPGSARR